MDWIDEFVAKTEELPSPKIFRLWSAIAAIGAVVERRAGVELSAGPIYPNTYILLVGPPASGKTIPIAEVRNLWGRVPGMAISPDNMTKASFIDVIARCSKTDLVDGRPVFTSPLACPIREFGVFFTSYDGEFMSLLTDLYDPKKVHKEERRTVGQIEIPGPSINMLAATQPDFLGSFMPEVAWSQGFTSRWIMIYAGEAQLRDIFTPTKLDLSSLITPLAKIAEVKGNFLWTKEAQQEFNAWYFGGAVPRPTHNKLQHYNGRRHIHVVKLAMISALSRTGGLVVELEDYERAKDWLLEAEKSMPDIFRAMGQKSDAQILQDLHMFVYQQWASVALINRKPVRKDAIYAFLANKVPSERIDKIIEIAVSSGLLIPGHYPDEIIPAAMNVANMKLGVSNE